MNSYKELALYDLRKIEAGLAYELWNAVGRDSQQACEKYLKHYLQEKHMLTKELSRTHNLVKLIKAIPDYDRELCKQLAGIYGYYFDTNYPGDDFVELSKEDAEEAKNIAKDLIAYVDGLV